MKWVGIFYLSKNRAPDRQRVGLPNGGSVYIRVQETDLSLESALDIATPRPDEEVMNTHELPENS